MRAIVKNKSHAVKQLYVATNPNTTHFYALLYLQVQQNIDSRYNHNSKMTLL